MTFLDHAFNEHSQDETMATIMRALDWLDANPDRRAFGSFAKDAENHSCHPSSPEAVCFCTLGRISVEAGMDSVSYLDSYLFKVGIASAPIAAMNDRAATVSTIRKYVRRKFSDLLERKW